MRCIGRRVLCRALCAPMCCEGPCRNGKEGTPLPLGCVVSGLAANRRRLATNRRRLAVGGSPTRSFREKKNKKGSLRNIAPALRRRAPGVICDVLQTPAGPTKTKQNKTNTGGRGAPLKSIRGPHVHGPQAWAERQSVFPTQPAPPGVPLGVDWRAGLGQDGMCIHRAACTARQRTTRDGPAGRGGGGGTGTSAQGTADAGPALAHVMCFGEVKQLWVWPGDAAVQASDVSERPYSAGGGGGVPPPPLPFQCLRLTAKILLRRLRCQEDLSFKIFWPAFGGGP